MALSSLAGTSANCWAAKGTIADAIDCGASRIAEREGLAGLAERAAEPLALLDQGSHARRELGRRGLEHLRRLAQRRFPCGEVGKRRRAGASLDAPHTGGDGALVGDLEEPDIARAADMCARRKVRPNRDRRPRRPSRARGPPRRISRRTAATAPAAMAASGSISWVETGALRRICAFTSASMAAISSGLTALRWLKSKRSRSGATSEPFWVTCGPRWRLSAACNRCVAE